MMGQHVIRSSNMKTQYWILANKPHYNLASYICVENYNLDSKGLNSLALERETDLEGFIFVLFLLILGSSGRAVATNSFVFCPSMSYILTVLMVAEQSGVRHARPVKS